MVYLPGIDGTGLAASRQFPFLVDAFDLHCLSIPGSDRTPFPQLISLIECAQPCSCPCPALNDSCQHSVLFQQPVARTCVNDEPCMASRQVWVIMAKGVCTGAPCADSQLRQKEHAQQGHIYELADRRACRRYLEIVVGQSPPDRPVYLLGESFGGVLALAVAHERPDLVDRVVLANPATSFQRSPWPMLGPLLPRVPKVRLDRRLPCCLPRSAPHCMHDRAPFPAIELKGIGTAPAFRTMLLTQAAP